MRALRKLGREPGLVLDEVPVPAPGADEVLVRVETASVCGTDLHIHRFDAWAAGRVVPPLTLGHELCGTVVACGRNVRHAREGDFVSAESHVTCGRCFHCRTGRAHMCERTLILGVDRDGGFADYVVVPESVLWHNDRAKLPPELACLQEPFGNAVFATSTQELAGRTVAVLGCGPVGLFTIAIARAFGAGRLLASDHVPFRLGLAETVGVDAAVDVDAVDDVAGWFVERNEGDGLDVVFEMSGALDAIHDAFAIARHGGHVVLFGIPARPVEIDLAQSLIFKNLTVVAVNGRQVWETWYTTRWLLEHGVVDLRPLISAELPLERFEDAFAALESGEACKIVFRTGAA
jgi:threonine 3-dehydrogenase